jgi:hypothetical protein
MKTILKLTIKILQQISVLLLTNSLLRFYVKIKVVQLTLGMAMNVKLQENPLGMLQMHL